MTALRSVLIFSLILALIGCESDNPMSDAERETFRQQLIDKALNDEVRKAGEAFLAENRQRQEVTQTQSGLQYQILEVGKGKQPGLSDLIEVAYEGRRVDGQVFDRATEDKPARFPLKQVIKGWREVLPQMHEGARWEIYVPADLAYGATSPSVDIPANSALIFNIKLLRVLNSQSEGQ